MCAIAGVVGHPQAVALTTQMTEVQKHRGPDGGAVLELGSDAAFGHRRLAIIDLSDRGAQPMMSRDGRWTIVFNGEIFNYRELRAQLTPPWRSETDTEVFLEAVAMWGLERALDRTIGMFAVALWDHQEHELLLARDRLGEKPLVYFWNGTTLAFASEMKALASFHGARLDANAVDVYFALGYVPAPLGIFRGTRKLPAGHFLKLSDRDVQVHRWWFPENASPEVEERADARKEQLRGLFADAARLRLRADVPVALALSGGVDSSAIAAELARQNALPDAFTVVFDDDEADLPYAQDVALRFGLRHEIIRVNAQPLSVQVDAAARSYDEPFADSSALACLALASAVGGRYRVVLGGDGGDEAFGGYKHYEYIAAKQTLKAAAAVGGFVDGQAGSTVYVESKTLFRAGERAALLNGHGSPSNALTDFLRADPFLRSPRPGALKRALWSDRHLQLANGLTHKMDIALSAHGVEGRAPLLDHRILEWAQNLEDRDLVHGREKKTLFRAAFSPELPPEVLSRRKHGFGAPVTQWLNGALCEDFEATVPCSLLDREAQKNQTGQRAWTLYCFARWAREWRASW
jgi:asparagine synthase (glutamine-hydrolysing)